MARYDSSARSISRSGAARWLAPAPWSLRAPGRNKKGRAIARAALEFIRKLEFLCEPDEPLPAQRIVSFHVGIRVGHVVLIENRRLLVRYVPHAHLDVGLGRGERITQGQILVYRRSDVEGRADRAHIPAGIRNYHRADVTRTQQSVEAKEAPAQTGHASILGVIAELRAVGSDDFHRRRSRNRVGV